MKTFFVCLILVLGASAFGWMRQREIDRLRAHNKAFRESIAEVERYQRDSAEVGDRAIDTNELIRLREKWPELMKLRSEIGELREAASLEVPKVQHQVETLEAKAEKEQARGVHLIEERAAKLHSSLVRDFLQHSLMGPFSMAARANGGMLPGSLAEFERMLETMQPQERRWIREAVFHSRELPPTEARIIGKQISVSAADFEWISQFTEITAQGPPTLFLREKKPRESPDGNYARWYAYTDGQLKQFVVPNGAFTEHERRATQEALADWKAGKERSANGGR